MYMRKKIPNYEMYEADTEGNIYSYRTHKVMKYRINKKGYAYVDFKINGKRIRNKTVHRLIASTFIDNPNNLPQVNHKDENKLNNSVDNLEWCTNSYNSRYGTRGQRIREKLTGSKKSPETVKKMKMNISTRKQVLQYDINGNFIREYQSVHECSDYGFNFRSVSRVCNNKRKTHKGFIFKFKE